MYFGLDYETSGTSHSENSPIQLGLANHDGKVWSSLIGGWNWRNDPWTEDIEGYTLKEWSDDAEDIHHISKDALRNAPSSGMVDVMALSWLDEFVPRHKAGRIAVGWNIASFDIPFLRVWQPETAQAISYRTVDLNAVCFYIGDTVLGTSFDHIKTQAKEYAAERILREGIFPDIQRHDAGYDAIESLYAWDGLRHYGRGGFAW